jgi:HD superfamily phosphohydrolase
MEGVFLRLLEAPELQRLHSIHQLGLAYLVYPGANHTRFEHSLGTYSVAGRICSGLGLPREESELVGCAALLHDVGHLPYSHTLEFVLHGQFGIDHAEISRRLIRGELSVLSDSDREIIGSPPSIAETLEKHGLSPKEVAALLDGSVSTYRSQRTLASQSKQTHFNTRRYLSQMISGPVDSDQLDYLKRDSYYTGVAYGVIDLDRLVRTLQIFNGDLVVDKGGVSAVEGMLVARALMFSAVYFHKTVRISELMLAKAVELLGKEEIHRLHGMTDTSLLEHLASEGGYCLRIATLLKYRRLFKKAYAIGTSDMSSESLEDLESIGSVKKRRSLEGEIAHRAGVDPGDVIVDVPSLELAISEPRISLTEIRVLDSRKVRMLPKISSIASSLQIRRAHEWAVMVAAPSKDKERVEKAAKKVLSSSLS